MSQMISYTIRIPAELIRQLDDVQIHFYRGISRSELVRQAIQEFIELHQEQSK